MHKYKWIISIILVLPVILITTAQGAEVKLENNIFSSPSIFITGPIEKGDYKKVIAKSDYFIKNMEGVQLNFILNSSGGNVEEAIKIGRFFRESLSQVYVWGNSFMHESSEGAKFVIQNSAKHWTKKNQHQNTIIYSDTNPITPDNYKKCYSACVLMFLGGVSKQISDNYFAESSGAKSSRSKVIPVIGLHRPYFIPSEYAKFSINQAKQNYAKLESLVRQYLKEMNSPQSLIDRMFNKASNEIDLVKDKEFRTLFHIKEPYYEEWIIAKCETISHKPALNKSELSKYKILASIVIENERKNIKGEGYSTKIKKYDKKLYTKLRKKLYSNNNIHEKCVISNTIDHQRKIMIKHL